MLRISGWIKTALPLVVLGLFSTALPGCVFWEIRDELKKTNAQLDEVKSSLGKLDTTNASLDKTNGELERVNTLIDNVDRGLGRIDTTNASLDALQKPLGLMPPIERSLARLDTHLAALRKTIGRIDSVMPFLDLGGGDAPGAEATSEPASATPDTAEIAAGNDDAAAGKGEPEGSSKATGAAVAPSPDAIADGQTSASGKPAPGLKRDPLAGVWLSKFPERNLALFLLPDGTFTQTARTPTNVVRSRGTWKRDGKAIVLQKVPEVETVTVAATGKTEERRNEPRRLEVVWSSSRAMALEIDEQLVVFERP